MARNSLSRFLFFMTRIVVIQGGETHYASATIHEGHRPRSGIENYRRQIQRRD